MKKKNKDISEDKDSQQSGFKGLDIQKISLGRFIPERFKINPKNLKKNYIWIIIGALILAFILAKSIGQIKNIITGFKGEEEKEMVEFVETLPVKVYKVKRMDFKDTLPVMGRIEGFKEIDLKFEEAGSLESFNFEEGERILEGDIIASLNQKDALLKLKYAALELEKAQKMYELGGYDKITYEQKKLEYDSAKRDLEKTNIYAMSDGYLGSKNMHSGAVLSPQDTVGIFVDYSEVYAKFDVIEEDSPKIELGQNVEVYADAYPSETFAGTVDMVSPMIEGRTRSQKIKSELENDDNMLKPGMFVRGVVNTYEKKDALMIPSAAFKRKEQQYFVYVINPPEGEDGEEMDEELAEGANETGVVEERGVEIEYLTHDMAEISKGLEEGELIVRELHQDFKDGDQVEITEVQETIF
jgi:RND family efflux transporter MFP subunit